MEILKIIFTSLMIIATAFLVYILVKLRMTIKRHGDKYRLSVESEITELENLIASCPPENVLELQSLKHRLEKVKGGLK